MILHDHFTKTHQIFRNWFHKASFDVAAKQRGQALPGNRFLIKLHNRKVCNADTKTVVASYAVVPVNGAIDKYQMCYIMHNLTKEQ